MRNWEGLPGMTKAFPLSEMVVPDSKNPRSHRAGP